jgi:hypothetical protein
MGQMALVVLGLFVLVWIISAVVKASQNSSPPARSRNVSNRPQPASDAPRVERTTETDIDRFMAEIDRLRRRGEAGVPQGRPGEAPRPTTDTRPSARAEPRPRGPEHRRDRERRPRPVVRPTPPPLPTESVPVLRPLAPEPPAPPTGPPPPPPAPPKPVKPAKPAAAAAVKSAPPSPVLQTIQGVLKTRQGPAAALILAEILGEPPGRRGAVRGPYRAKHG